jgi:small-conductance mechanosensitive channel
MNHLTNLIETHQVIALARAVLLLGVGLPLVRMFAGVTRRVITRHVRPQVLMLAHRGITYVGSAFLIVMAMHELGFHLTALLGAAGIAGVAIGFASQTSLSNLVSGLFLVWEQPFEVGDVLAVGDVTGSVHSIDLLSVQVRTFDNKLVRIPNENLIKTQFTNITRFPIRRLDIDLGVAYKENVDHVVEVLKSVAEKNPLCLDEPAPVIVFKGFGDSALQFLVGLWFVKADALTLRNSIMRDIKARFDAEGIEIPFPHRTLYAGSVTEPFPVRMVPASPENGED